MNATVQIKIANPRLKKKNKNDSGEYALTFEQLSLSINTALSTFSLIDEWNDSQNI